MSQPSNEPEDWEASEFVSLLYRFLAVLIPFAAFIVAPMFVTERTYILMIQIIAFFACALLMILMEAGGAFLVGLMFLVMVWLGNLVHGWSVT